jgi:lysozyme
MNSNKQNFSLNDDAVKRIDEEFSASSEPSTKRRRAKRTERRYGETQAEACYAPAYETGDFDSEDGEKPRKKKHRLGKILAITAVVCAVVILLNIAFFFYRGQIWFNEPRKRDYPVRGAVVTQELGKVDWSVFAQQNNMSFVYIRATKGTTFVDSEFEANKKNSAHTELLVGYIHEFDFRADGAKQAENYINECGDLSGKLCPVVKVTKYGIYNLHLKNAADMKTNLADFISAIEEEYGVSPVIMCDTACYTKYIEPYFDDYALWKIDRYSEPDEDIDWSLWEYNPRVRTSGYENKKKYYALTVFRKGEDLDNFEFNMTVP